MSKYGEAVGVLKKYVWVPADYTDFVWCKDTDFVKWFVPGHGVFCMEYHDSVSIEEFAMFELDNGCGHGTFQGIFSVDNEIARDEFDARYGDD